VIKKEKVLMLTAQYMPDVYGGAEKQCGRLAKELLANAYRVSILTSTQRLHVMLDDEVPVKRFYTGCPPDLLGRWLPFSIYWFLRSWCARFFIRKKSKILYVNVKM